MRERSTPVNQLFDFDPFRFATRTKKRALSRLFPVFSRRKGIPIWVYPRRKSAYCIARSRTQCYNSEVLFHPLSLRGRELPHLLKRRTAHVKMNVPGCNTAQVCIDEAMSMLHLLWHSLVKLASDRPEAYPKERRWLREERL